jgi:hypothetical protein
LPRDRLGERSPSSLRWKPSAMPHAEIIRAAAMRFNVIFDSVEMSRSEGLQTQLRPGPTQTRIDLVCQPNSVKPC